jgi:hypothetical protein
MERDKTDFEDLWNLAGCREKVEYHIGCSFDESDRVMFESPKMFTDFVDGKFCICFTATPSNCDKQGVEAEVIKALGFRQFDYTVDEPPLNVVERLRFDKVNQASTLEQKTDVIRILLQQGSVLVYSTRDLL